MHCDALILGGGIAGLWTLAHLSDLGYDAVLAEPFALGAGQTIWSQGIIHGGLKYTLRGAMTRSAESIRDMPERWTRSLQGEGSPDLSGVQLRAEHCHLWNTQTFRSRAAMIGARVGLRSKPELVTMQERPLALMSAPGHVARIAEPVVEPQSLLSCFSELLRSRIVRIDPGSGIDIRCSSHGGVEGITLRADGARRSVNLTPRAMLLCAGAGNAPLRSQCGLNARAMQIRPLRMVLVRGDLPALNAHCVDGMATRITITTPHATDHRNVWQIGGEIAELGAVIDENETLAKARAELCEVLPGLDFSNCEWATYEAPRAEGRTVGERRPEEPVVMRDSNVITMWPSKLALAPRAAELVAETVAEFVAPSLPTTPDSESDLTRALAPWPRPAVATPPWLDHREWYPTSLLGAIGGST